MKASLLRALSENEFFAPLAPPALERLARGCRSLALEPGQVLFSRGDPAASMYLVAAGELEVWLGREPDSGEPVGRARAGDLIGEMRFLNPGPRLATVRAAGESALIEIPVEALEGALGSEPGPREKISELIRTRIRRNQLAGSLSGLLGGLGPDQLDYLMEACRWAVVPRGRTLFRQGEPGRDLYLVVTGRFLVTASSPKGEEQVLGRIGRGEPLGEMAIISGQPRSATVTALRDSQVILLPGEKFLDFLERFPRAGLGLAANLVDRLVRANQRTAATKARGNIVIQSLSSRGVVRALLPDLIGCLSAHGSTLMLDAPGACGLAGLEGLEGRDPELTDSCLTETLDRQEEEHDFLVLAARAEEDDWTRRALSRADQVLLLGRARDLAGAGAGRAFPKSDRGPLAAPRLLGLIHPAGAKTPARSGGFADGATEADRIHLREGSAEDLERLARTLAGQGVGLVLGGGGARGLAHIGVIRALREKGLPFDFIGGCSMGAIIAAMAALDWPVERMIELHREAFVKRKPLSDYTIPRRALLKGKVLEKLLGEVFGPTLIQETWKPFFCVSSDLNTGELVVHRRGLLWPAIRASLSLPGIFLPVGREKRLLVDGGLLNNLPVDVMRAQGASRIIAVDVSNLPDPDSGPEAVEPPPIMDTLMRSMTLSSLHAQRRNRDSADLYLNPPVDGFGFMEFEALDDLVATGYEYASQVLAGLPGEMDWTCGRKG